MEFFFFFFPKNGKVVTRSFGLTKLDTVSWRANWLRFKQQQEIRKNRIQKTIKTKVTIVFFQSRNMLFFYQILVHPGLLEVEQVKDSFFWSQEQIQWTELNLHHLQHTSCRNVRKKDGHTRVQYTSTISSMTLALADWAPLEIHLFMTFYRLSKHLPPL